MAYKMYLRHNWQAFAEKWTCLYILEPGSKTEEGVLGLFK